MARLAEEFINNIKPKLISKFKYKNQHQVPKISKIELVHHLSKKITSL